MNVEAQRLMILLLKKTFLNIFFSFIFPYIVKHLFKIPFSSLSCLQKKNEECSLESQVWTEF